MKLMLVGLLALLVVSCSTYDHQIIGTVVTQTGWVYNADSGKNVPKLDTAYTVEPSVAKKHEMERKRGDLWGAYAGAVLLVLAFGAYIWRTSIGDDKVVYAVVIGLVILGCAGLIGGSTNWVKANMAQSVSKPVYDSLMKTDGNLHAFWDKVRF